MELRLQLVALTLTAVVFIGVLELVRRRRLLERYAVLWLVSTFVLLTLAAWKGLLESVAGAVGIHYAPSALFMVAFGFVLVLLLHFSVAVSRLAEQSKVLAQRLALAEERPRQRQREAAPAAAVEASVDAREKGRNVAAGRGFRRLSGGKALVRSPGNDA